MSVNLPWFSKNAVALGAVALSVGVLAACSSSSSSSTSTSTSTSGIREFVHERRRSPSARRSP